jgi:hypothetical protein
VPRFRFLGDRLISTPRYPDRDLRLERLGERDGLRSAHLGDAAQVSSPVAGLSRAETLSGPAYQALIDAVFTAPGAAEWLRALRRAVAAMLAEGPAPREPVARDSIRAAGPRPGRP